jgi:biofilm PGA synthesis N-glycosyltransferase PgaC
MSGHKDKHAKLEYVLITPARNEEAFIERTIQSVISQTELPKRWVIVSDGSTDRTDEIAKKYAAGREWIEFIRVPERKERHFAGKVHSFNAGYECVRGLNFDIIGNLDADISFEKDFFEYLLEKFEEDPGLGVAGTDYIEGAFHSFRDSYINVHHVNGQCQLFRRECFRDIGGYVPIKGGGIDWAAVTTARMKGWKTRSFQDRIFVHHRTMGGAESNILSSRYHYGKKDYSLGNHPLWELFRVMFQLTKQPYVLGGLCLLAGYSVALVADVERPISKELIRFHRREQMERLKGLVSKKMLRRRR